MSSKGTITEARAAMEAAADRVAQERNSGSGQPSLAAVDALTDAVNAYLAAAARAAA